MVDRQQILPLLSWLDLLFLLNSCTSLDIFCTVVSQSAIDKKILGLEAEVKIQFK